MQNTNVKFEHGKITMDEVTYDEIISNLRHHGDTDLPSIVTLKLSNPMKTGAGGVIKKSESE